jgi:hypothetical protein
LKKHCLERQCAQLFFKYFPIYALVFEKMSVEDVVCSSLGLNELKGTQMFWGLQYLEARKWLVDVLF